MKTKVTVFTGFLGAGKTTILISLISKLNPNYKIAILKNEFGDSKTDSQLFSLQQSRDKSYQITEMVNGCLCCVLVGQMKNALEEIQSTYSPQHIIIETSGSAFPAPIAWQIRQLEQFELDAIITVIDCINFMGYEDTSFTAKLQAQYTDLILLNKWEDVNEQQLDKVIDRVNDLNTDTPKIKYFKELGVDPELIIGLNSKLHLNEEHSVTDHHSREVDLILIKIPKDIKVEIELEELKQKIINLDKEYFYRIKGLLKTNDKAYLLNFAFSRGEYIAVDQPITSEFNMDFTIMGVYLKSQIKKVLQIFQVDEKYVSYYSANKH